MGVFSNPIIVEEPDLNKIWSTNFEAGRKASERLFKPALERKEKEAEKKAFRENVAGKLREAAGSTLPSLRNHAMGRVDEYFQLLKDYDQKKYNSSEFINQQGKYFSEIKRIKELGVALETEAAELSEKNLSSYQNEKGILGLAAMAATGNDSLNVETDENGKFIISFLSPETGNPIKITEAQLGDPAMFSINEVLNTAEISKTAKDNLKSHLVKKYNVSKYDLEEGGKGKIEQQVWDKPELADKEKRVEYVKNINVIKGLDSNELGSLYNDYILKNKYNVIEDSDYVMLTKNLTQEQKAIVNNAAQKGYLNGDVQLKNGSVFNPANVLDEFAKTKLAREIVEEGPQATRTTEISTVSGGDNEKEAKRKEQLNTAMPIIGNIKVPRDSDGRVDVGDSSFYNELARLNLAVDKAGFFESKDDKVIAVKSNITNKSLNITGEMNDLDVKNALMLLSGATTKEADKAYPIKKGLGVQENLFSEELSTGNLPTN